MHSSTTRPRRRGANGIARSGDTTAETAERRGDGFDHDDIATPLAVPLELFGVEGEAGAFYFHEDVAAMRGEGLDVADRQIGHAAAHIRKDLDCIARRAERLDHGGLQRINAAAMAGHGARLQPTSE